MEQKKTKRPRIGDKKKNDTPARKNSFNPDWSVWDIITPHLIAIRKKDLAEELAGGYKNHAARIKDISMKTRNMDIIDAFGTVYDIGQIKETTRTSANALPDELRQGATIKLTISDVSKKNGVIFESGAYKTSFITRNNLSTVPFLPKEPVSARIVELRQDCAIVDVLGPMAEDFIMPRNQRPWIQNKIENCETITVRDLKLVRGGFTGKAIIRPVTEFLGRPYEIDAFIPGSQIVLNTTDDFEQFEGATVETFLVSCGPKPNGQGLSLICSRKNVIKHQGYKTLMEAHKMWCEDRQEWDNYSHTPRTGFVTGVINSSKKCGVFVEVPELSLTGLVPTTPEELTSYKINQEVEVFFSDIEEDLQYNEAVDQKQHVAAFEIEDGAIKKCNIKPILSFK